MDGIGLGLHRSLVTLAGRKTDRQDHSRGVEGSGSGMSTSLNMRSPSPGGEQLLRPSVDVVAASAIGDANSVLANRAAPAERRLPFGLVLSPGRTLHQGIISLADQAVASATNFATGIIIARACSKEELGLYMLGFSLI